MEELENEVRMDHEKEFEKIEIQAEEEYQFALQDLEEEGLKLLYEETTQLKKDLDKLKKQKKEKENLHIKSLENKFLSEITFENLLQNEKFKEIENEILLDVFYEEEEKIELKRQRKIREIMIKLENKEDKIKKTKEIKIKEKIFEEMELTSIEKENKENKNSISSMKSEYNVKIKKIDNEIKAIKERNKLIEPKENIQILKNKLEELQNKKQSIHHELNKEKSYDTHQEDFSQADDLARNNSTFSHLDESSEYEPLQPPSNYRSLEGQIFGTVKEEEDYSESESEYSEEDDSQEYVMNPPVYHPSAEVSEENLETYQSNAPILRLNVAGLLRANWEDPIQKYTQQSTQPEIQPPSYPRTSSSSRNMKYNNENESINANRGSFQEAYHMHLEKLNKAGCNKKLSTHAKNSIIKNLAILKRIKN